MAIELAEAGPSSSGEDFRGRDRIAADWRTLLTTGLTLPDAGYRPVTGG